MTTEPESLIAGANDPHGKHEVPCESWDCTTRRLHGYDPDADGRGRHAVTGAATEDAA